VDDNTDNVADDDTEGVLFAVLDVAVAVSVSDELFTDNEELKVDDSNVVDSDNETTE
jgi:hypothetical protein